MTWQHRLFLTLLPLRRTTKLFRNKIPLRKPWNMGVGLKHTPPEHHRDQDRLHWKGERSDHITLSQANTVPWEEVFTESLFLQREKRTQEWQPNPHPQYCGLLCGIPYSDLPPWDCREICGAQTLEICDREEGSDLQKPAQVYRQTEFIPSVPN